MASLPRSWMKIQITMLAPGRPEAASVRNAETADAPELGMLMDNAYRDTVDHEGETLDQCLQEMQETLSGKYGALITEASFVATHQEKLVSAVLVTEWKGLPLVAYSMTHKSFQGRGLGKHLLRRAISGLSRTKWRELYLVVTDANTPAIRVYEKVGFQRIGPATPGTPPPT